MKGIVKWYIDSKGFGFILGEDGQDYFVHFTEIRMEGFKTLVEDEHVEFDFHMKTKPNGLVATNVRKLNLPEHKTEIIKNCPCCGSKADVERREVSGCGYDDGYDVYGVHCTKCPINTGPLGSKETAIKVWNRRV